MPGANSPESIAAEIHAAGDYPDSLQLREPPTDMPQWLQDIGQAIAALFEAMGPALQWIGYGVLAILVLFLLQRLYSYLSSRDADQAEEKAPAPVRTLVSDDWLPSEDPDALGQAGEFERAIAVLLLLGLRQFGWGARPDDRARTAREVLKEVPDSDLRRAGLKALVDDVEPLRFGGVVADALAYDRVRTLFHNLRDAR